MDDLGVFPLFSETPISPAEVGSPGIDPYVGLF